MQLGRTAALKPIAFALSTIAMPALAAEPFSVIVIPDTQNYADFDNINQQYNVGQMQWIRDKPLYEEKISPGDIELLTITDDVEEACEAITRQHRSRERARQEAASQDATEAAMKEAASGKP